MARGTESGHTLAGKLLSGAGLTHRKGNGLCKTAQLLVGTLLVVEECQGVPLLVPQLVPHQDTLLVLLPSHSGKSSVLSLENVF